MPAKLALLLCVIVVVFLLWLERRRAPKVTWVLWLPTIWMLYTASKTFGSWFPSSGGDPELGSPLDRAFLVALLFAAFLLLILRKFNWGNAFKENPWVIVLLIFMLLSIVWSSIPYISFKRWTRELIAVLMAFSVLSEPSPRESMESILRRTTYILIPFSVLLIKYFPQFGVQYGRWFGAPMWTGMAIQKNGLGRICLIAAFFLIWSLGKTLKGRSPRGWKYQAYAEFIVLVITVWLMRGPDRSFFYSATSFYALCAGLLVYGGLKIIKKKGRILKARTLMITVAIVVIFGTAAFFNEASNMRIVASSAGRSTTLTDRTLIWAVLLPIAMQKPILGHGFGGFWLTGKTSYFDVLEAHNGYLDVLIGLGFSGLLLTLVYLLSSSRKAHRELSNDFEWGSLWICFLIMTVVHNIAETSIDSFAGHLTALILFFSVSSTRVSSSLENPQKASACEIRY
jgi:exopolysaccharide production protein ExoQ